MDLEAWAFWIALLGLLPLGATFALQPKRDPRHSIGKAVLILAPAISILAAWKVHSTGAITDEVELVAVLLHLSPAAALLGIGSMIAVFGGPTPVGEIPRAWRAAGFLAMATGVVWFWHLTTVMAPATALNNGLLSSWPRTAMAALLAATVIAWLGFGFTLVMGSDRNLAAGILAGSGVIGLILIERAMHVQTLHEGMVGALDDLIGGMVGITAAATILVTFVYQTELRMTPMEEVPALTDEEMERAKGILANAISGGEEE